MNELFRALQGMGAAPVEPLPIYTCAYCGIETDAPCGFANVSLGCTKAYYARRDAPKVEQTS